MIYLNIFLGLALFISLNFYLRNKYFIITDKPNSRSMHIKSKPTIGGLFLILTILVYFYISKIENLNLYLFILSIAIIIGILDDLKNVNFFSKLLLLLFLTFFITYINFDNLNIIIFLIFCLFIFHFINIFNFMDGTDGTALSQSIFFLVSILVLRESIYINNINLIVIIIFFLILLYFNFPDSKLFIGNIGSYSISTLIIMLAFENKISLENLLNFTIIFLFFYLDTSTTLIKRLLEKKNIFTAHREHLYQVISTNKSHLYFIVLFNIYNFFIILPFLYIANTGFEQSIGIKIIFILINIFIYLFLRTKVNANK